MWLFLVPLVVAGRGAARHCRNFPVFGCKWDLRELTIFVSEIWLDISRKSLQHSSRDRWNRRVWSAGRAAPKKGHMSLEVSAFHNVPQFLQAIILIPKRGNKCIQRMQMINKIFAWHFSPRAKVPNSGSAGNVRAVWTRPIRLTLPICLGWLLLNDARNLVRVERITGKPKCGESSDGAVRFRCRCSRGHNQDSSTSQFPANSLPEPAAGNQISLP
jgi:hypothetical protein